MTVYWQSTHGAGHIPLEFLRFRFAIYRGWGHFYFRQGNQQEINTLGIGPLDTLLQVVNSSDAERWRKSKSPPQLVPYCIEVYLPYASSYIGVMVYISPALTLTWRGFQNPYRAPEIDGPGHYNFQDLSQQKSRKCVFWPFLNRHQKKLFYSLFQTRPNCYELWVF